MAVWAVQSACVSTVNRNEAGSRNPVVVELFFAFWTRQPRHSVRSIPWKQHENNYEDCRRDDNVD